MPKTTLQYLIDILKKYPDAKCELYKVEQDLCAAGVVGFGVEPFDIIVEGIRRGLCTYNPNGQIVSLKPRE